MNTLSHEVPKSTTAALALANGRILFGQGMGLTNTVVVGEVCFNTSASGYQETLTDPSYAGQIITFTFPHIGNVGVNEEDMESTHPRARGLIVREAITVSSNWRAKGDLGTWLAEHGLVGIYGVDTRAIVHHVRDTGAPLGALIYAPKGDIDVGAVLNAATSWNGLEGLDLAAQVTCAAPYAWNNRTGPHVVAVDYGAKHTILRCLAAAGCRVTVVPAQTTSSAIFALKPDGVFLSNGPGDPAATAVYAAPMIRAVLGRGVPLFGICLGHQLLALALGAKTRKMHLGHRGANHPVKDLATGRVEITSQNHGFEVICDTLPPTALQTHVSLFDGSNEGLSCAEARAFSVQYHPEASPGPHDSQHLFTKFVRMIKSRTP